MLFLHDLTRTGQADYDSADADIAAALQSRLPASVAVIDRARFCLPWPQARLLVL